MPGESSAPQAAVAVAVADIIEGGGKFIIIFLGGGRGIDGCDGDIDGRDGDIDGRDGDIDGCDGDIDGCDGDIDGCDGDIDGCDDDDEYGPGTDRSELRKQAQAAPRSLVNPCPIFYPHRDINR
jgi:hypothetical protein